MRTSAQHPVTRLLLLLTWILPLAVPAGAIADLFPLRVSGDRTHLVDAEGRPFLLVGDTAWSLVAQLDRDSVDVYLADRQRRGFNAIIVNLIEAKFATRAPATRTGVAPFLGATLDFTRPNPAYFDWARECVAAARRRGIAVFLCPAYLGWGGGDEGFFKAIARQGPEVLRGYGRFVAERFADSPNVVWMPGGDYTMPAGERWAVDELAQGIRERDTVRLMTGHAGQASPRTAFGAPAWLQIDNTYSYEPALWKVLRADAAREPRLPVFLSETVYEGEHDATPEQVRRQAWWAMLAGHCGQFFGNNPIWHFDGPGLFKVDGTWRQALDGPGSRDTARLGAFFRALPWWELSPDPDGRWVREPGEGTSRIAAAGTVDGRWVVVYVPGTGPVSREFQSGRDLKVAGGANRAVVWWNPADGSSRPADLTSATLRTPGDNGRGAGDWVLRIGPAAN